jgi:hypothetical protein
MASILEPASLASSSLLARMTPLLAAWFDGFTTTG